MYLYIPIRDSTYLCSVKGARKGTAGEVGNQLVAGSYSTIRAQLLLAGVSCQGPLLRPAWILPILGDKVRPLGPTELPPRR